MALRLAILAGTVSQAKVLPPTLPDLSPLGEPSVAAFFGLEGKPQPVERVREVTADEFDARVRLGRPFIIADAGRGIDLAGASCELFHQRFPKAQMRAEYTGSDRPEKFISLGSKAWFSEDRRQAGAKKKKSKEAQQQTTAPYVWHVKDGGHEAPPDVRAAVQRAWQPPYFVRGATNLREANESAEFWFHRRNGSVLAHADTYCIPAVSLQLTGRKHWRLMPHPHVNVSRRAPDSHDGGIYRTKLWDPLWEATVEQGEAIVFFPNLFHETRVPEDGNPECTVATTFQLQLPVPARYFRAFLPTHAMSHLYYEGHCLDLWHSFATLKAPKAVDATESREVIESQHAQLFSELDVDGDGFLSLVELKDYLAAQTASAGPGRSFGTPWPRWFYTEDYFYDWRPAADEDGRQVRQEMEAELLRFRGEDMLAYLDCCPPDGQVSEHELLQAMLQWHVAGTLNLTVATSSKPCRTLLHRPFGAVSPPHINEAAFR
ncbi:yjiC [Symbiodinium natans]|uniref:YjiC protein n=1 Tax=Symbiodinium natans TaxID=878477 RepID=A0A812N0E7_9DINO|nr:yjiC [Symbiodinium natans]